MKTTNKQLTFAKNKAFSALFLLALLVLILPAMPAKAATVDASATICKGRTATLQLKGVPDGYKVKWKNTNSDLCRITKKSLTKGVAQCKVKGKAKTKGVIIKAKLYNKSGKRVHTYRFKVTIKAHNYKLSRKATCQKKGKKVCQKCNKAIYTKKKSHTYKWVYGGMVASGRHLTNNEIDTYRFKKLDGTGSNWAFRDDHICNSIDLRDKYGTPYSHVASKFSEPYPKVIDDMGKVYARVRTWTVKYNDTETHYAQGGTWSGYRLLDRQLDRSDTLKFLDGDYDRDKISCKFDSVKDIKGYADITRWYCHSYTNGFLGDTWQNTYYSNFWQAGTPGKKMYVLQFSDSYYRYFVYTFKPTCH